MANDLDREDELWHGSYSGKDMARTWIVAGLLTLLALGGCILLSVVANVAFFATTPFWLAFAAVTAIVWIVLLGQMMVRKMSIHYRLTTQRLVRKTGLLNRKTGRVEVIDIDDVSIEQTLMQRLLGVGRIKVMSSDASDPVVMMLGIEDPTRVAELIDKARRDERVKRGVHIEQV